jgi:RNA-directed DNA polymerase
MNLKDGKQQNIQKQLDFPDVLTDEAREASREEPESSRARSEPENPASTDRIMEEICEWKNLKEAMWRVKANKGSAGIDGMTVDELPEMGVSVVPAL